MENIYRLMLEGKIKHATASSASILLHAKEEHVSPDSYLARWLVKFSQADDICFDQVTQHHAILSREVLELTGLTVHFLVVSADEFNKLVTRSATGEDVLTKENILYTWNVSSNKHPVGYVEDSLPIN